MDTQFDLQNKTVLITGGSSGIGRATAFLCAELGARVIIVGRDINKLADNVRQMGDKSSFIVADLTVERDLNTLIDELPSLNGIVHCAGIGHKKMAKQITMEDISQVMGINFNAPVLLQSLLLKKKKITPGASIVFIASKASSYPCVGNGIYSASKGALISYSKCLALELAPKQIRVNCVCPAMIWTDLILQGTATKEDLELEQQKYPLMRYGSPKDVASMVGYLLSDAASWLTNCCYDLTGGTSVL
ncbi:MAG: SDR family oxidoreductase [Prevotella sp.]|nr:SDR family oxidoreductase [Prevotella sp.]